MKRTFKILNSNIRILAAQCVNSAPEGYVVEVKPATRTTDQNAKLWAMLSDISKQVDWHGRKLSPEDWKHVFTAALTNLDVVPNIDGTGFVVLGKSTSKMDKKEFSDLIEIILAFGAEHNVKFSDLAREYLDYQ